MLTFLVTGGAGFIGSAVIREIINNADFKVVNVDKLTYAGNLDTLADVSADPRYHFEQVDICDSDEIERILNHYRPDVLMHLAAESHVDRSIDSPSEFIMTNVVGTYNLLEKARDYWKALSGSKKSNFKFHHISTDEVYGDLTHPDQIDSPSVLPLFNESSPYKPSSPYSASKAGSDHLVRAWHRTFGLPTVITNCSNNYGPFHFPEKLIPLIILNALEQKPLPIYGKGNQIRDWLYVEDHAKALIKVALEGEVGQTYNIGGHNEMQNIEVVQAICRVMDELVPKDSKYEDLISYVPDRPGHDMRYAIDASKIHRELDWKPIETFESGIRKTVAWYLNNLDWCEAVLSKNYERNRLGVKV